MGSFCFFFGPPHLALNPPYFLFVLLLFFLFSLLFYFGFLIEKACVYPKKGMFVYFLCLPLFLFGIFGPPPFSLSLSMSLSCLFLSSFLSVSHFCIWFLLFIFVLFDFCFKMLCCFYFFCLLSCFVLNHNSSLCFPLHLVFYCFCCFVFVALAFCYLLILGTYQKHL